MPSDTDKPETDKTLRPGDAMERDWIDALPRPVRPYLRLSRYDRPAGFWLLAWPCWMGLLLVWISEGFVWSQLSWVGVFGFGAIAMRGAGCVWNDILDRQLDSKVRRTRSRPLASGQIGLFRASLWMLVQCALGLLVLIGLPIQAKYLALGAIPLVSLYPLMKRITYWPQIWLGLTFNWGVLIAAFTIASDVEIGALLAVYAALVFWTLGYDTIYALADKSDDRRIGIRSTALLFGDRVRLAVAIVYALSLASFSLAAWMLAKAYMGIGIAGFGLCLFWQVRQLTPDMGDAALRLFRSNVWAGGVLAAPCLIGAILHAGL